MRGSKYAFTYTTLVSVAMMKLPDKKQLGGERVYLMIPGYSSSFQASEGGNLKQIVVSTVKSRENESTDA